MIRPSGLCFIEPRWAPTDPIVDDITRKATALLHACSEGPNRYRGVHGCTGSGCSAMSDNTDHALPDGRETTSLLVHYVARHRSECAAHDLKYIAGLAVMSEPTAEEIQ